MADALDEVDIGNHHLVSAARAELGATLAGALPPGLSATVFAACGCVRVWSFVDACPVVVDG